MMMMYRLMMLLNGFDHLSVVSVSASPPFYTSSPFLNSSSTPPDSQKVYSAYAISPVPSVSPVSGPNPYHYYD
ncbi:hypothetical protein DFS34DRAFT_631927 [Phlyctochytrium arcticum]|nr:hypothetical protein DFS34DRAFT_631927 [Phlyctochytrium arcticum]